MNTTISDGTGYVDDGREIFDDDDEEDLPRKNVNKSKKGENKKRLRDISDPVQGKGSIKSLFGNAVPKKKDVSQIEYILLYLVSIALFQTNVKLEDDNILADILGELDGNKTNYVGANSHTNPSLKTIQNEKNMINEYMASFSRNALKKRELKEVDATGDDVSLVVLM